MSKDFFDYEDGDFVHSLSDNMAIDSDGNMMMQISDHLSIDIDSGDLHFTSLWDNNGDND
jgi:hypothetical protein